MIGPHVTLKMKGLRGLQKSLQVSSSGPIRDAYRVWARQYRSFAQQRFSKYSRGGGDWPDLAESTKKGRRGPRKGHTGARQFGILYNIGLLFGTLQPVFASVPGQHQSDLKNGVRVGFGGLGRYPDGKATIADIAAFHQEGSGRLPKREIIVEPDEATLAQMKAVLAQATQTEIGRHKP